MAGEIAISASIPTELGQPSRRARHTAEPAAGFARLRQNQTFEQGATNAESTGLGSQLIEAFSTQLEGEASAVATADSYRLSLRFKVEDLNGHAMPQQVVLTSAARPGARH